MHFSIFRIKAMELASEEGFGSKSPRWKDVKNPSLRDDGKDSFTNEITIDDTNTESYIHRIKTAFEPLLRRLFNPLNGKKYKKTQYQECLIDCLLENKGFCPIVDLSQIGKSFIFCLTV